MKQQKTVQAKQTVFLWGAAAACLLALVGMILALTLGHRQVQDPFVPPPFDPNACTGTPQVPEALDWQAMDAQVFRVSVCGVVVPSGASADIWLTNPADNQVWLKLRVLDAAGNILGETGLIRPGEYLRSVTLKSLPKTGSGLTLKIMAYQPDTYHSAGAVSLHTVLGG